MAEPGQPRYAKHGKTASLDSLDLPGDKKTHKFEKSADPSEIVLGAMRSSEIFDEVVEGSPDADYGLEVRFQEANLVGAYQTTVNLVAVYSLKNRASGETVAAEEIATSTTISAREISSGGKRLKATVSAAFLDSIDSFLFRIAATMDAGATQ